MGQPLQQFGIIVSSALVVTAGPLDLQWLMEKEQLDFKMARTSKSSPFNLLHVACAELRSVHSLFHTTTTTTDCTFLSSTEAIVCFITIKPKLLLLKKRQKHIFRTFSEKLFERYEFICPWNFIF